LSQSLTESPFLLGEDFLGDEPFEISFKGKIILSRKLGFFTIDGRYFWKL
jgi:hypothetical protein